MLRSSEILEIFFSLLTYSFKIVCNFISRKRIYIFPHLRLDPRHSFQPIEITRRYSNSFHQFMENRCVPGWYYCQLFLHRFPYTCTRRVYFLPHCSLQFRFGFANRTFVMNSPGFWPKLLLLPLRGKVVVTRNVSGDSCFQNRCKRWIWDS